MNIPVLLFDVSPISAGIGIAGALVFFFAIAVVAFIAFKMLKRSVKMAFRIAIVAVLLVIALVGSISFFYLTSGTPARPRPARTR